MEAKDEGTPPPPPPPIDNSIHFPERINIAGNSCPKPEGIPNGKWNCQRQELPVPEASFLDGDENTYPSK